MQVAERQRIESQGREIVAHLLPDVGSRWECPAWENPDFDGAWEVKRIGEGAEFFQAVILQRCSGRHQEVECGVLLWPSGWIPVEDVAA